MIIFIYWNAESSTSDDTSIGKVQSDTILWFEVEKINKKDTFLIKIVLLSQHRFKKLYSVIFVLALIFYIQKKNFPFINIDREEIDILLF